MEEQELPPLFFYGTLLAPPVLHRVIFGTPSPSPQLHPSLLSLSYRSALLSNYRRHRVLDADYPAILTEAGGMVRGTLVSGLTEGDVWRLDVFEGDMYERQRVRVRVLGEGVGLDEAVDLDADADDVEGAGKGEVVEAETYVWINPKSELEEKEWDFEVFKKEKMRAWMGEATHFDGEEVKVDEGFEDVDRAVAAKQKEREEAERREQSGNGHVKDPTGGRGLNGFITRKLEETRG